MEIALDDISDDFQLWVSGKGHFAREHNVKDHTKGPNVNLGVVVLKEHLRGNVVRLYVKKQRFKLKEKSDLLTDPLIVFIVS
jgi:hypothetical protein